MNTLLLFLLSTVLARPNFIVILVDDMGYGDLDLWGVDTPAFSFLKYNSVEFTQAYSADSICSPSRAAILTGKYPQRSGIAHNYYRTFYGPGQNGGLPQWTTTIAELLLKENYSTSLVGKWHLGINK